MELSTSQVSASVTDEILSNLALIVSAQSKDTRQASRCNILAALKKASGEEKAGAVNLLLEKLSLSMDTCQQNYLIDILACQVDPDLDDQVIKIIEAGNGNFEGYIKTYAYSIYKKHAPENKHALVSI